VAASCLALKRLEEIFDAKKGSKHRDELELLSLLIDNFEKNNHAIHLPDPIEAANRNWLVYGSNEK
jgi:HTH-type transcriptional regulator/antitoxin HigA